MPSDYLTRAASQLTRDWKRGKITQEEYVRESLKLSAQMKEEQYLRAASFLLDAKKLLADAESLIVSDSSWEAVD